MSFEANLPSSSSGRFEPGAGSPDLFETEEFSQSAFPISNVADPGELFETLWQACGRRLRIIRLDRAVQICSTAKEWDIDEHALSIRKYECKPALALESSNIDARGTDFISIVYSVQV